MRSKHSHLFLILFGFWFRIIVHSLINSSIHSFITPLVHVIQCVFFFNIDRKIVCRVRTHQRFSTKLRNECLFDTATNQHKKKQPNSLSNINLNWHLPAFRTLTQLMKHKWTKAELFGDNILSSSLSNVIHHSSKNFMWGTWNNKILIMSALLLLSSLWVIMKQ